MDLVTWKIASYAFLPELITWEPKNIKNLFRLETWEPGSLENCSLLSRELSQKITFPDLGYISKVKTYVVSLLIFWDFSKKDARRNFMQDAPTDEPRSLT